VTLYKTLYYVKLLQEKYELLRGFFQLDRGSEHVKQLNRILNEI